jgi:hypothetical protein
MKKKKNQSNRKKNTKAWAVMLKGHFLEVLLSLFVQDAILTFSRDFTIKSSDLNQV